MKTLLNFKSAKMLAICLTALLVTGCGLRMDRGEDLAKANEVEIEIIKVNLVYIKDQNGNCFAILNNHTDGFRSTFTMAGVNCSSVGD